MAERIKQDTWNYVRKNVTFSSQNFLKIFSKIRPLKHIDFFVNYLVWSKKHQPSNPFLVLLHYCQKKFPNMSRILSNGTNKVKVTRLKSTSNLPFNNHLSLTLYCSHKRNKWFSCQVEYRNTIIHNSFHIMINGAVSSE